MSTAIFIDGAYLDAVCKWDLHGARIDFKILIEQMADGDAIASKTYYHCPVWLSEPPSEDERRRQSAQRAFFAVMTRRFGFSVKLGKTVRTVTASGDTIFNQRKVDVLMAVDITNAALARRTDRIALLSGNADLAVAVRIARQSSIPTTVWCGTDARSQTGMELKAQAEKSKEIRLAAVHSDVVGNSRR